MVGDFMYMTNALHFLATLCKKKKKKTEKGFRFTAIHNFIVQNTKGNLPFQMMASVYFF